MTQDDINNMIIYFNIFKETATNNIGFMHGFPNWVSKMSFRIENEDLVIVVPPVLIKRGTYEIISHSRRKSEVDDFMKKKNYTYIEFVIRSATEMYSQKKGKTIISMSAQQDHKNKVQKKKGQKKKW